jgi:hypothetical protein
MGILSSIYSILSTNARKISSSSMNNGPKSQIKEALAAGKLKMLAQMTPTRWGSMQAMAKTMLAAEAVLHKLVTFREFVTGNAIQKELWQGVFDTVTAASFVDLLKKYLTIEN